VPRKLVGGVVPELPVSSQFWEKAQTENKMARKVVAVFFIIKGLMIE
jgi:hypothetical protein